MPKPTQSYCAPAPFQKNTYKYITRWPKFSTHTSTDRTVFFLKSFDACRILRTSCGVWEPNYSWFIIILLGLSDLYMSVNRTIIGLGNGFRHKANPWNQCGLISNCTLRNRLQWNFFYQTTALSFQQIHALKCCMWNVVHSVQALLC